jgi:hypothetical protein
MYFATRMNEVIQKKFWDGIPLAARLYSGGKEGVVVRENGKSRPLNPHVEPNRDRRHSFSWGSTNPEGKLLAMALLKDALEDDNRAYELADVFAARVISILPERWTMTRQRIVSYADVMALEKINDNLFALITPGKALPQGGG